MGPSPSEGAELERRNSQESTNYRRPAEQQHQPSHHVQPSNPGKAVGIAACPGARPYACWGSGRLSRARGFAASPAAQHQLWLTEPPFPPSLPAATAAAAAVISVLRLQGARGTGLYAAQRSFWRGGEYSPRARSAHPDTSPPFSTTPQG